MNHIIEQERHGFWIAASFIVGLLALVTAFSAIWRLNTTLVGTQMEIVLLNNKIDTIKKAGQPTAPATAPVADAAAK